LAFDGADNHSRYTKAELFRIIDEADVQVYTIAVIPFTAKRKSAAQSTEDMNGIRLMADLTESSYPSRIHQKRVLFPLIVGYFANLDRHHRNTATMAQIASTNPKGHAP
jgi:hypothetical protein